MGDEVMAAGQAKQKHAETGRKVMIRGADGRPRWHDMWRNLPFVYSATDTGSFAEIVNGPNARPYIAAKAPARWTWKEFRPPPGEIFFGKAEQTFGSLHAGRIVLEPHIKQKASPNKRWSWINWNKLAWLLQEKHGLRVTQIGPRGAQLLDGVDFVETPDFRHAAAVLATARTAVLHEGGLTHAAAAVGCPAAVIRGAFIGPRVTGYDRQTDFFEGEGLGCGMRVPCACCEKAMAKIKPEAVAERLLEVLRDRERTDQRAAENAA